MFQSMQDLNKGIKLFFSPRSKGYFTRKDIPAVIALGTGILLSLLTFILVDRLEFNDLKSDFLFDAENYSVALGKSIDGNLNSLHAIEGLFASSVSVTRARFRTFVNKILPHSAGIHELRWAPRVAASERKSYEAAAIRDGFSQYRFTELDSQRQLVTAGKREEYYPVYFAEPTGKSNAVLGLDLSARPAGRALMEKARDTGAAVATRRIMLRLENDPQFAFLVFQPLYRNAAPHDTVQERRKNLIGFAMGVFRMDDMVNAALKDINLKGVELSLFDEKADSERRVLYSNVRRENTASGVVTFTSTVNVADRIWTVQFHPTPDYLAAHRTHYSWAVLAAGLISTFFLALYVMNMKRRTEEQQLRRISAERQVVETQLRMLQAQIEPHFLFNTLANVMSLIDKHPQSAKKMLQHFTGSLRQSLQRSREDISTLAEEADMLRDYLSVFKMRLGPRLDFAIDIPKELLNLPFPPMLLQPLVENAIKHGIEPKEEGGRIDIKAEISDGLLRLTVSDTGVGLAGAVNACGFGLENVKARLHALYRVRADLILEENIPCGTTATLEVPV